MSQETPKTIFVIIDESGGPELASLWEESCHEQINEACGEGIEGAGKWVVREYQLAADLPPSLQDPMQVLDRGRILDLQVIGVSREAGNSKTLRVTFKKEPTDDDLRALHRQLHMFSYERNQLVTEPAMVQACRPADRAMLETPAGQELLRAAVKKLRKLSEEH